jgi:YHS domain-containing protein
LALVLPTPMMGTEQKKSDKPVPVALKGLDATQLVAGKEVKGVDSISVTHKKFRYLFANTENKALFEANPDRYAIQGDGSCIVHPVVGVDPNIFTVHEGKVYSFAMEKCKQDFTARPAHYLDPKFRDNFLKEHEEMVRRERERKKGSGS